MSKTRNTTTVLTLRALAARTALSRAIDDGSGMYDDGTLRSRRGRPQPRRQGTRRAAVLAAVREA